MFHYVLFKLRPGFTAEDMKRLYDCTYARLSEAVPEITATSFRKNCITRDSNMDVLITLQMTSPSGLESYLKHPLHLKFVEDTCEHVIQKVSFDWEEGVPQVIHERPCQAGKGESA